MSKPLVVVESPAKAKTIAKILGKDFVVESSVGHIRDLPATASDIPAAYKGESWARLGVDVENDFKPLYVIAREKKQQVKKLKGLLKGATELYLATDEDREGESIAWHLLEVLSPQIPVKRMVFHEITPEAVRRAVDNPRDLDRRLVDAQEGRRILDRLYGYEVSPVLWKKVMPGLSAGRVQSVATRLVVERERERIAFRSATYWDIQGTFVKVAVENGSFGAALADVDGQRVASGKDFGRDGTLVRKGVVALDEERTRRLVEELRGVRFEVRAVEQKPYRRSPYPPFMTSTLQQAAARLGFTARRTMQVAQSLYDNGYITYMRTDNTTLSAAAVSAARGLAKQLYGTDYVPDKPRRYQRRVKNAQEAHEAIRPAGDRFRMPEDVARAVSPEEARLYELIWKRTIASQMVDEQGQTTQVRLGSTTPSGTDVEFSATGKVTTFPGFRRAYVEGSDDPDAELEDREVRLPSLSEGDELEASELVASDHSTEPPGRYSEASLVKKLEDMGVGRPSTYASIIATIQDRGYVWKKGSALVPSWTAFAVVDLLESHFEKLVDYDFTAAMEEDLDEIATGEEEQVPWLHKFYFGNGDTGLHALVTEHVDEIDAREVNSFSIGTDAEGREIFARVGRFGPYLQRGDDTVSISEEIPPDEMTMEKASSLFEAAEEDRILGKDPETGLDVHLKTGRFGPYFQLGDFDERSKKKPPRVSLFKSMDPSSVTLEDALRLLTLPRIVGSAPDGEDITAQTGRFGPYIKKGKETRSLESEEQIFTIGVDEALALLAQPRKGRRRASSATLKELGEDPNTGGTISLKEGRYGPYVTDGKTNASLPKGESPADLELERAVQLLVEKRAKGPPKRRRKSKK